MTPKLAYCSAICAGASHTEHEIYGIKKGEETPFGPMVDQFQYRCLSCGHESLRDIPRVSKRKTTWPYYNESCGVTFESESHEQKYAAVNKLEKI